MATKRELLIVMKGAPDDLLRALDKAKRGFADLGKSLQTAGKNMTMGLTLPIIGIGAAIVTTAAQFESSMNKVAAITGATGDDFKRLRDLAKDLGATTKFSASEAADGMSFLAMAGFNTNQIISAMPGLLNLAAAGQLELAEAADITSNILTAFGEGADQAGRAADLLATVAARTNTNVQQVGAAMSFAAPIAKSFGLTMEEAAGFIGVFSDAGVQADRAGVALRAAIVALADPTDKAAKALEKLKVETVGANGEMRPFGAIIKDLAASGMSAQDAIAIFGGKMASAGLIAADAVPKLGALAVEFENMDGNAKKMADTMNRGLSGGFTALRSALEGLAIEIADSGLLEFLTELVANATAMVRELSKTNPELLKWGTLIAAAAAAIGPLLWAVGGIATGVSSLAGILAGTSGALKAFMAVLGSGSSIFTGLATAFPALGSAVGALGTALAGLAGPVAIAAGAIVGLGAIYLTFKTEIDEALLGVQAFASEIGTAISRETAPAVVAIKAFTAELVKQTLAIRDALSTYIAASPVLKAMRQQFDDLWPAIARVTAALFTGGMSEFLRALEDGFNKLRAAGRAVVEEQKMVAEANRVAGISLQLYADEMLSTAQYAERAAPAVAKFGADVGTAGANAETAGGKVDKAKKSIEAFAISANALQLGAQAASLEAWGKAWDEVLQVVSGAPKTFADLKQATDAVVGSFQPISKELQDLAASFTPATAAIETNAAATGAWEAKLKEAGITSQAVADGALTSLRQKLDLATEGFNNGTVSAEELKNVQEAYNTALGITNTQLPITEKLVGIVGNAFDAMGDQIINLINGTASLGDAFKSILTQIAQDILQVVVKGAMEELKNSLLESTDLVSGLADAFKSFFGLFGGGNKKTGGAGGGGGGGEGGGIGGGGGGAMGPVIEAIKAIMDLFQIFQLARIEKDIGRIEVTTRGLLNEALNLRADQWAREASLLGKLDQVIQAIKDNSGLKITGGTVNISLAFPPEFKEALDDMVAELKGANSWLEKIKNWTEFGALYTSVGTDYLREIRDKIGAIAGTSVQAQAPISIGTLSVQAPEGANPRRFAEQLLKGLEQAGGMRSGSVPALVAG